MVFFFIFICISIVSIAVLVIYSINYIKKLLLLNELNKSEKIEKMFRDEMNKNREEFQFTLKITREEISGNLRNFYEQVRNTLLDNSKNQIESINFFTQNQESVLKNNSYNLNQITQSNMQGMENLRRAVETQLQMLRNENITQLDKMRNTVDEKLQSTLEQRLSSSFKQVGDRLDAVNSSIGEMQKIASEVGNLQRVLTTVKSKGILGEIQLERILMDILTIDQYEKNVKVKNDSNCFVEFAVKLPHKLEENSCIWLPIDAKFPTEDYLRLQEAQEQNNFDSVNQHIKSIESKIKSFAKEIREKYLNPPYTTDFAILFLPTEGLYSEILRIHGLYENLRRDFNIVVAGPSTLSAILNSLQMGFRTLAVEKRTNEVSKLLGAVKTDFIKFGDLLEKTQKKLDEASKQIGDASYRSKQISRKLMRVESLPADQATQVLALDGELTE